MIDTVYFITLTIIFIILIFATLKGPTLWDRILTANECTTITAMTIVLYAVITDIAYYVDVALVFVLVSFVGTQFYASFISRLGRF